MLHSGVLDQKEARLSGHAPARCPGRADRAPGRRRRGEFRRPTALAVRVRFGCCVSRNAAVTARRASGGSAAARSLLPRRTAATRLRCADRRRASPNPRRLSGRGAAVEVEHRLLGLTSVCGELRAVGPQVCERTCRVRGAVRGGAHLAPLGTERPRAELAEGLRALLEDPRDGPPAALVLKVAPMGRRPVAGRSRAPRAGMLSLVAEKRAKSCSRVAVRGGQVATEPLRGFRAAETVHVQLLTGLVLGAAQAVRRRSETFGRGEQLTGGLDLVVAVRVSPPLGIALAEARGELVRRRRPRCARP